MKSKKPNLNRLRRLADFLETIPDNRFDMRTWGTAPELKKSDCGTAGCACGWATALFKKQGLILMNRHGNFELCYKRSNGYFAAADFFKITTEDAHYLFSPYRYHSPTDFFPTPISPNRVVRRIRSFLRRKSVMVNPFA